MPRRTRTITSAARSCAIARSCAFLESHADFDATFVLPGFMFGPGDAGPTASGQLVLDFARRKLPGLVPGSFAVVDARDVAAFSVAVAERGRRGEKYLCAGRHMTMFEVAAGLERATGTKAPRWRIPIPLLFVIATGYEAYARITGQTRADQPGVGATARA